MNKGKEMKLSKSELTEYINKWCFERGIKSRDLGCSTQLTEDGNFRPYQNAHPAIDDVIILIKFRDSFWSVMNKNQRKSWNGWWKWAYTLKKPSRHKHYKKMATMAIELENNLLYKNIIIKAQREKIKTLRQRP